MHEQWLRSEARAEWANSPEPAQPAGVWVKTSERKPAEGAEHLTRYVGPGQDERRLKWTDNLWKGGNQTVGSATTRDWLDTSPQPDADGWIAWDPAACKGHEGPKNADEARLRCGEVRRASTLCSWGVGVANKDCEVVAYRTAK